MWDDCLNPKSIICLAPNPIINAGNFHLLMSRVLSILGIVFVILGIISETIDVTIGLQPISWFLGAIGAFVASIPPCLGWAVAVYLKAMKPQKEQ